MVDLDPLDENDAQGIAGNDSKPLCIYRKHSRQIRSG